MNSIPQPYSLVTPLPSSPPFDGVRRSLSLEEALDQFLQMLEGKNRSVATLRSYRADITQFTAWLHENNSVAQTPAEVERADITAFLAALAHRGVTGVSRARKLAALREYFRFLEFGGQIERAPTGGVETPKKERTARTFLRPDEYTRMLSLAGGNPRDYAVLQTFLQTGIRVSELCNLRLADIDMLGKVLRVTVGKGMAARDIEMEKKGVQALKNWLSIRPNVADDHVFLNYLGEPISERGVRKLVVNYRVKAGITKKASCHSLRHTFATFKAEQGVSPFQLKDWLGHANLNTTQIYVHMGRQNAKKVMEATSL